MDETKKNDKEIMGKQSIILKKRIILNRSGAVHEPNARKTGMPWISPPFSTILMS
jgi:hypothetical protein